MKQHFSLAKIVFVLVFIVTIIGFSAFSQQKKDDPYSFRKKQGTGSNDSTTSGKRNRAESSGDFDRLDLAMRHLEGEMKKLESEMKKLDVKINMKEVNVDMDKVSKQIEESLKNIEWDKINQDIENSLTVVSKVKMQEVKSEMQKVRAELQKQKIDLHLDEIKIDAGKIKLDVEKAMKSAKEDMLKAKEEIKNLQAFTSELQKDGLINKSKGYKLEVKEGELYIDGKKQPKEINDKYRKYYRKSNFTLDMSEGDSFSI